MHKKKTGVPWATGCLRAATMTPASSLCWSSAPHSTSEVPFTPHKIWRNLIHVQFLDLCQIWGKWGKRLLVREGGTVVCSRNSSCKNTPEDGVHQSTACLCHASSQHQVMCSYLSAGALLHSGSHILRESLAASLWQLHFTAFSLSSVKCQRCWWDSRGNLRAQHGITWYSCFCSEELLHTDPEVTSF